MRYYELLYIVNSNFEPEKVDSIIKEIGIEVEKSKVSIINNRVWAKKRLAYPVQNNKYGTFIILQFGAEDSGFLLEFERYLILNKEILRHQLIRLDAEPEKMEDEEVKMVDETADKKSEELTESTEEKLKEDSEEKPEEPESPEVDDAEEKSDEPKEKEETEVVEESDESVETKEEE